MYVYLYKYILIVFIENYIQKTCNSTVDLVKFTFRKKKNILTIVTLLKATLGVT